MQPLEKQNKLTINIQAGTREEMKGDGAFIHPFALSIYIKVLMGCEFGITYGYRPKEHSVWISADDLVNTVYLSLLIFSLGCQNFPHQISAFSN